jgi:hypothetical protein
VRAKNIEGKGEGVGDPHLGIRPQALEIKGTPEIAQEDAGFQRGLYRRSSMEGVAGEARPLGPTVGRNISFKSSLSSYTSFGGRSPSAKQTAPLHERRKAMASAAVS